MTIAQPLVQAGLMTDSHPILDSYSDFGGIDLQAFIEKSLQANCRAVFKLAAPATTALCTTANRLVNKIAKDLEARLLRAARNKKTRNGSQGSRHDADQLSARATSILDWTGLLVLTKGQSKAMSKPKDMDAEVIAPCYESFLLFVAHHVKAYVSEQVAAGLIDLQDCRLILPIAQADTENEGSDDLDPRDFVRVLCGMLPLTSNVESQTVTAPHLVVADTELMSDKRNYDEGKQKLATETRALYFRQHNRRFAWGLTVSRHTIRAYVFGFDAIWSSSSMSVASAAGRRAFILLLVNWSLCSVDRLGFDPSIRYALGSGADRLHFEIDVHEKDASTGEVASRTYYSNRCVAVAPASFTGRHARCFAASASVETMDDPTVLIKDMWLPLSGDCSGDTLDESAVLNVLYAALDRNSELRDKLPQLVNTGPVYVRKGDRLVEDTTAMALAGLPTTQEDTETSGSNAQDSLSRQHMRTVMKWAGDMISAAKDPRLAIIAIADAMTALNAAYGKCKIIHGNISDQAILFRETADGAVGALAEFEYAAYVGEKASAVNLEAPMIMAFQSIRSLEHPETPRTRLDDWESLLYLVICLGTYGVNEDQQHTFIAAFPNYRCLPIASWKYTGARFNTQRKRSHLHSEILFRTHVYNRIHGGPLRDLALAIYKALFLHPGCTGALINNRPGMACGPDPLVLRDDFADKIVRNLLQVLKEHKQAALAELSKAKSSIAGVANSSAEPTLKRSWDKTLHLSEKRPKTSCRALEA
ncbi:hypothetical protein GGI20_002861 [Coemansia sp. BCRC 34301]|nr:hypothetical protein GGI20_002861 [Coemansia sp. BCRC 34301]